MMLKKERIYIFIVNIDLTKSNIFLMIYQRLPVRIVNKL